MDSDVGSSVSVVGGGVRWCGVAVAVEPAVFLPFLLTNERTMM
jgi:hypothetical protein